MYDRTLGPSTILALGIIVAAALGSYSFYKVHTLTNTLSVTGSATATTTADSAKWTVSVSHSAYESGLGNAQTRVAADTQAIVNFLTKNGIDSTNILVSPVFVDRDWSNNQGAPVSYNVHEDISVTSDDVHLIEKLSKDISSLMSQGIVLSIQQPQYYISDLPKLRVSLIGAAVKDAKARATEIAKSTGQSVGALQSASSGVVQVMQSNSIDVSDYGSYDTSTIDKQVMITTRATFYVR